MYPLHHSPDNGETTGFCGERVDLIGALPDIAKETFNGIGGTDIPMHDWWKIVKREEVFFVFHQAAHGFGIAFLVFALKRCQVNQCLFFGRSFPDPGQFRRDGITFALGNSVHHVALFMHDTPLAWGDGKKGCNGGQQSLMPVCHDQVNLGGSALPQIV